MNYMRIVFAGLGAFAVYFAIGGVLFTLMSSLKDEFGKYPAVYRPHDSIMRVMPYGMAAMLLGMLTLAVLYARSYQGGPGWIEGAYFGALIGVFTTCAFVIHNHVNLNIGLGLTIRSGMVYFLEWLAVGIVIGLIY